MIFASMSGNTEEMADHIAGAIRETENEIEVIDIMDSPEDEDVEKCLQFGAEFVKHLS